MLQFRATFLSIHFKCFEYKYDEKDAGDRDHFRKGLTKMVLF